MPALQTTYPLGQPAGFAGMHADMAEWDARTRTATAAIDFGAPVQRNGDEGCAPFASGGEYLGIAGVRRLTGATGDGYAIGDNVPVADEGCFFGTADAAITVGAALRWNTTNKRWTTAVASGTVIDVPQAEAETAASGAGVLFKVRLRRIPS
jgi:hypothetical protein